jgi:NADPH:quinone reductase-like Zn-dependent oxidoreductase
VAERACRAIGQELDMVADLVGHGTLVDSLPVVREGGRAGSIVELAGDLELAVDRNITLHGVLMRPSRQVLGVLAAAVASGSLRPVVDQVLDGPVRRRRGISSAPGPVRWRRPSIHCRG